MCFGGGKQQAPQLQPAPVAEPAPEPAPAPTVTPSASSPMQAAEARRKKIFEMARYGMQSTIKTSPQGVVPELAQPAGAAKEKLGS